MAKYGKLLLDENYSRRVEAVFLLNSSQVLVLLFGFNKGERFDDTQPQHNGIHLKQAAKSHTFIELLRA